jgi:predicted dehydrogenase
MALDMTPEQKATGKDNFNRVVGKLAEADDQAQNQTPQGITRRRFMQGLIAAGATVPISAAAYFGYQYHGFPNRMRPVKAAIIGTGDEGGVLVGEHNPNFVKFIACCDVRPSNQRRIFTGEAAPSPRRGFNYHYGSDAKRHIEVFDDYKKMLRDKPEIEMVVIALPLHLHAKVAIDVMDAGKHVLCEKLMAWNISQCKAMIRKAEEKNVLLSIGHQRHYSMLYAHANEIVHSGVLGDVNHVRALWHRNNVRPNPDPATRDQRPLLDSWWPLIPDADRAALESKLADLDYKSMEELVRWRLYTRTGGGLMAELGSHQLDACSIFLRWPDDAALHLRGKKKRPLSVTAVGGTHFYGIRGGAANDNREVEDHVYCIYEFPGDRFDFSRRHDRKNDIVTITYSSISTNGFEKYGECVMGSKGTLVVEEEQNAMLWGIQGRSTEVTANTSGSRPVLDASSTTGAPSERVATATGANALGQNAPSRGYREEMEHLAYCIRMLQELGPNAPQEERDRFKPRCDGKAAMADAIIALSANQAMKHQTRIEFKDKWFDDISAGSAVPDSDMVETSAHGT